MEFNQKIKVLHQEVTSFSSIHHQYHYQESDECFYLSVMYFLDNDLEKASEYIKRSLFYFSQNQNSIFFDNFLNNNSNTIFEQFNLDKIFLKKNNKITINIVKNDDIFLEDLKYKELNIAKELFLENKLSEVIEIFITMNQNTKLKHINYHLNLADLYFKLALFYKNENLKGESLYFLNKALETEKTNKDNDIYKALILKLSI